ncbi:hypothetical protein DCS_04445 [Drechmeria coniospora]|uniref:Protein phosphatase 4 core regulatory subunit R2 n=1 Tax=Drechmeria coniospora TaxID=98403 RepID=A0A151GK18_DRECN|nr:hypothetical protein DCS_04445 [Drechmeria coniospora]KYK57436.1 hypothetical protein DCS_04445 [Drechmeria coniospora]
MHMDDESDVLRNVAADGAVEEGQWPALRADILARLDKIARNEFPIPNLRPPPSLPRLPSAPPSSSFPPSSEEADKENAPARKPSRRTKPLKPLAPGELPKPIADLLDDVKAHLETFDTHAPHTIQRLAELVLRPRAHYKALASYLHAVDRVAQVTSGTDVFPLPPAVPDLSAMNVGAEEAKDPATTVTWSNPTTAPLGSDEALGGALLTPIPWLARSSPESNDEGPSAGAQIHSEGTETIDGPNGMGSIETVSVSVNGVPSTGHARGVTQGELLRQEQRAGVVPVTQLSRNQESPDGDDDGDGDGGGGDGGDGELDDDEDEVPHARGPEEIGVNDTGPQVSSASAAMGEEGFDTHSIDVEAAVGRKQHLDDFSLHDAIVKPEHDPDSSPAAAESSALKRGADQKLESGSPKRFKEGEEEAAAELPGAAHGVEEASAYSEAPP